MSAGGAQFRATYASALRTHLGEPTERTLRAAYELGRDAVVSELSVLDLAAVHHEALLSALRAGSGADALEPVTRAAADFYLESLSAFEMVQRGFREARQAALLERRQATMLRQLSSLLADASLAFDASGSFEEMLWLVAEQARELTRAQRSRVTATVPGRSRPIDVTSASGEDSEVPTGSGGRLVALLATLDGRELGSIEVADPEEANFTEVDEAVLVHVAQMASAALERAQHYAA